MIGHSAGASAIMYSTKLFLPSQIPYHAIILVEPPLIDRDVYYANLQKQEQDIKRVSKVIAAGKSSWKSSEAAFEWMKSRQPWKNWDSRVLQIYIAHGLYTSLDHNGAEFVTVKCPKQREIDGFNDITSTFDATDCIGDACKTVPIHIIFGAINDLMPIYGQKSLFDTSKGRIIQSVAKLPGVGHMIVQEKPDLLSATLDALLQKLSHSSHL
jgi:pimeloyl-ACP methyl ester carboxylesterase